jgi:UDP-N-acetylmuramyl pentapeptide phosphotransferase/UDP-N-acetylglucosamine-1-phosphate transferase
MTPVRIALGFAAALLLILLSPRAGFPAFALSALLITLSMPLMRRYAMARPNARSGHSVPTPQGAGAPVMLAIMLACVALAASGLAVLHPWFITVLAAAGVLAVIGAIDDIRPLKALPRLGVQLLAVGAVVFTAPETWRLFPGMVPAVAERSLLVIAGAWFVNLTNFIDGLDGITIANLVPVFLYLGLADTAWVASASGPGLLSLVSGAALLAFLPWNAPRAHAFLGDVGSLPLGLIAGAALLSAAALGGSVIPPLILVLYPLLDATLTLFGRIMRREKLSQAHRLHAYQRAFDSGMSARRISLEVLALNLALVVLAHVAPAVQPWSGSLALAAGIAATLALIHRFRSVRKPA